MKIKKKAKLDKAQFSCNLDGPPKALPHFWEKVVGSGHATLALRADWQAQLKQAHQELGFEYVRFHGLFGEDMGLVRREKKRIAYSFFNSDQIFDFLIASGMHPFVELSFMPEVFASGPKTVFHYNANVTPPRDEKQWALFVKEFVKHCLRRYGLNELKKWYFEVWNEPNLKNFWTGTKQDYFKFYKTTAQAIKEVHHDLQVGGPATAKNAWVEDFLKACDRKPHLVDFVSTHQYPTDAFGNVDDDTISQLAKSQRSALREQAQMAHRQAAGKPLYYTEWSSSSNPFDELHDQAYASAFICKTVLEARGLVEGYSYWTFSDIFEENYFSSDPFHGGFGLLNIHGIAKPSYRAFQLLHRLGDEILHSQGMHSTVDIFVTRTKNVIKILVTNTALPLQPLRAETVVLHLLGLPALKTAYIERIDDQHANARTHWEKMGKPRELTPNQVQKLKASSEIRMTPISLKNKGLVPYVQFQMPKQGTACISLVCR